MKTERVAELSLREWRELFRMRGNIWLWCLLEVSLWRSSRHIQRGWDCMVDPELLRLTWERLKIPQDEKGRGMSGIPCLACCQHNPIGEGQFYNNAQFVYVHSIIRLDSICSILSLHVHCMSSTVHSIEICIFILYIVISLSIMWKVHCSYCFDCTCVSCSRNNVTQLRNLPAAMIQGSTPTLEFSGRMLISQSSWEGVSFSPRYETPCENTPDLKYITYEDLFRPSMDISRIILHATQKHQLQHYPSS